MRIISLHQPWASLVALGFKQYETRSFKTNIRGHLAIHAAKRKVKRDEILPILYATGGGGVSEARFDQLNDLLNSDLPLGCIVAIADLVDCLPMSNSAPETGQINRFEKGVYPTAKWHVLIQSMAPLERAVGVWEARRFAWKLKDVLALPEPIPYRGHQGIGKVPEGVQQQIATALNRSLELAGHQRDTKQIQLSIFED